MSCRVSLPSAIIFLCRTTKHIILVELTVPWETNIPKDHAIKTNKYYELRNDLNRNGYVVNLYAVEVGATCIPAKYLYNLLKDLGLSRTTVSSILERVSKAALAGSYQIWLAKVLTRVNKRPLLNLQHESQVSGKNSELLSVQHDGSGTRTVNP